MHSTKWSSPSKRRRGPRTPKAQTPGRRVSTHGVMSPRAATTGSNRRASRASSDSRTTRLGHRAWASRRRWPLATPQARADTEEARTRPPSITTAGSSGPTPRAVSGQSGHQTTRVRTGSNAVSATGSPGVRCRTVRAGQKQLGPATPGRRPPTVGDHLNPTGPQAAVAVVRA